MDSGLLFLIIMKFAAANSVMGTHKKCQLISSYQLLPCSAFSHAMAAPVIFGHGWLSKAKAKTLLQI